MSLRAVHICFILLATGLAVGFGFWALPVYRVLAPASFATGAGLLVYLVWFVKKIKQVEP